ncbi:MAG: GNAT family N-acetyltransferase [Clostridia bacterium]|jgi:ribosomal-protein-alanine N-acetyltransferase|nr:GNAT family N-acetyltransferase [Clostridia bacterium]
MMQQAYCERIFSDLPVLETSRLRLRPLKMGDAQDMFRYASDPEVSRHVLWETHESLRDSRRVLRGALRQYRRGEPSSYAVERRSDHRMIGTIGFMWVNLEHRSGEVGYSFARDCWGQGYATEALRAVLQFGFDTLRLHRIEAQHEVDNPASGRVMEKCGMQCEGVLRGRVFNKGHFSDVKLYAILRENNMMDNDK